MMNFSNRAILDMQRNIDACSQCIDALAKGVRSNTKTNAMLDAAMQKIETCCINMRRLCEENRPPVPPLYINGKTYHTKETSGEVTINDMGWVDICLHTLLPHCRTYSGSQYIADTITYLLNHFKEVGGPLPMFEKAFVAIVEHCPMDASGAFDQDNKAFKTAVNALKGRLFHDDNQFELSLGLFTVQDSDICCHIYVMPFESSGDFLYQMAADML